MQSSYRVIKNDSVLAGDVKSIVTDFKPVDKHSGAGREETSENEKRILESYESIAENIVKSARKKADSIMSSALMDAQIMKEDAYREGYDNGYDEGSKKGYNDAYEQEIVKARQQAENIIEAASTTMRTAKNEYEAYLNEKKDEIVDLSISIARQILKREVEKFDGIDQAVLDALDNSIGAKNVIIRANSIYIESLKDKVSDYQFKFGKECVINVLTDDNLEKGKAIIEKDNGRAVIDVEGAIEKILEVIK